MLLIRFFKFRDYVFRDFVFEIMFFEILKFEILFFEILVFEILGVYANFHIEYRIKVKMQKKPDFNPMFTHRVVLLWLNAKKPTLIRYSLI